MQHANMASNVHIILCMNRTYQFVITTDCETRYENNNVTWWTTLNGKGNNNVTWWTTLNGKGNNNVTRWTTLNSKCNNNVTWWTTLNGKGNNNVTWWTTLNGKGNNNVTWWTTLSGKNALQFGYVCRRLLLFLNKLSFSKRDISLT